LWLGRAGGWGVGRLLAGMVVLGGVGLGAQVALPLLPTSVAYDAAGNLFFADTNRHEVYESSLGGVLTVVTGNGVQGFSGDGGAATGAELNSPQGVAVGADGTLYIADTGNERIRVVRAGVISTFAGNGSVGFAGDGGAALGAEFRSPNALVVDAMGALLVSDAGNARVRRISAGVISTVVGNGVQGFGGDGGAAVAAEIDTPMGLAVGADGRVFVADSHNDRIRVVGTDGEIATLAGNGVRGFAGDGGAATAARLSLPRGLMVTAAGMVIFADSNNQRIRMVSVGGVITTIVGSGVQGAVVDGGAAGVGGMNSPRGVAVSGFGSPVYADALSGLVRESVASAGVYLPAGLAPARVSTVTLSALGADGQLNAGATVAGVVGTPQGMVELLDGTGVIGTTTLVGGVATFSALAMSAGTHALSALYLGDGVNPAATSAVVNVGSGAEVITATANGLSLEYGLAIPTLTGVVSGVLAGDTGNVTVVFTSAAVQMSVPGTYAIVATLSGPASAKYSLVVGAGSGSVVISQATTLTVEQPLAQGSYAGLPLLLTAGVSSTTEGTPTGTVQFMEGSTVVATGAVINGVAGGTYLSPGVGLHSIVASYGGDGDFVASTSMAVVTNVGAMPDFTVASSGSATQTVVSGGIANFGMTVGGESGAFTGVVDLSASGLPPLATVSFSPPQVVPGSSLVSVTMSVQTNASVARGRMDRRYWEGMLACLALPWVMLGRRRKMLLRSMVMSCLFAMLGSAVGCGARSIATTLPGEQTYALTVTGTSTNLAGVVVHHAMNVTLVVQ
jgi:hypothetical protein